MTSTMIPPHSPEASLAEGGGDQMSARISQEPTTVYWIGTEDEQHRERMNACQERRKLYGQKSCDEKDGSCDECSEDMARALSVTKARFDAHMKDASHD